MLASQEGHPEAQKVLLEAGADVSIKTKVLWEIILCCCTVYNVTLRLV